MRSPGSVSSRPGAGASLRPLVDVISHDDTKVQVSAGVLVSLYEESCEATAVYYSPALESLGESTWAALSEVDRHRLNAAKSLQRTKSTARRYAVANILTTNWTMTTEGSGCFDRRMMIRRTNRFLSALRDRLGEAFPYLYVLELHPGGHGYHVHLLLQERFLDKHMIQRMWGGIVFFSRHDRDKNGNKVSAVNAARIAAGYLLKYVSKDWEAGSGQHCYERSTGFNHPPRRRLFRSFAEARIWLSIQRSDAPVVAMFSSEAFEDWHGPPVEWMAW